MLHVCYMHVWHEMYTFTFPLHVTDRNVAMLHFGSICKPVTVQLYVYVFVVSVPPIFPHFCQSLCSLFSSLCAFLLGGWALVRSYFVRHIGLLEFASRICILQSAVGVRSLLSQCPPTRRKSRTCSLHSEPSRAASCFSKCFALLAMVRSGPKK